MLRQSLPILAAACCGVALFGCGPTPSPGPSPPAEPPLIQSAWDNHFGGFGAGVAAEDSDDEGPKTAALDQIMKDYDADSVVRVWDNSKTPGGDEGSCSAPACEAHTGSVEIRTMFTNLFVSLKGCSGGDADQLKSFVEVDEDAKQVFLVWKCEKANFLRATDSFIFDGVIIRNQNIVVSKTNRLSESTTKNQNRRLQDAYDPDTVAKAWANHFDAFSAGAAADDPAHPGAKNAAVEKILKDYTENSVVRVWDFANDMTPTAAFEKHKGLDSIKIFFNNLFDDLSNPSDLSAPLTLVQESPKQVFLVWKNPAVQYQEATDTFVFDANFKITAQNIALYKTTRQVVV